MFAWQLQSFCLSSKLYTDVQCVWYCTYFLYNFHINIRLLFCHLSIRSALRNVPINIFYLKKTQAAPRPQVALLPSRVPWSQWERDRIKANALRLAVLTCTSSHRGLMEHVYTLATMVLGIMGHVVASGVNQGHYYGVISERFPTRGSEMWSSVEYNKL